MRSFVFPAAFRFAFFAALSLAAGAAQSAGISGVQGSVTNGQTITITGSGFGTKANAKPLYFWDFGSGTTDSSSLSRQKYTDVFRGSESTVLAAPNSKAALRVDMGGTETATGPTNGVQFDSNSAYVWLKRYYGFDINTVQGGNGFNLKSFRLWYPWTNNAITAWQPSWGTSGTAVAFYAGTPTVWFGMPFVGNTWLTEEYDYQSSSLNKQDGVFQYIRNGVSPYDYSQRFGTISSDYPNRYNILFLDQVSNNEIKTGSAYLYFDALYVDDSRHRVLISNEATWSTAVGSQTGNVNREIQIPTAWNDTQVQVVVRQGAFSSLAGKYLYIVRGDGTPVSTTGFALCSSGTTCGSAPPNPPTNVAVH